MYSAKKTAKKGSITAVFASIGALLENFVAQYAEIPDGAITAATVTLLSAGWNWVKNRDKNI